MLIATLLSQLNQISSLTTACFKYQRLKVKTELLTGLGVEEDGSSEIPTQGILDMERKGPHVSNWRWCRLGLDNGQVGLLADGIAPVL